MSLPAVTTTAVHRHRQDDSLAKLFIALDFLAADADRLAEAGDLYALADGLNTLRKFRQACSDVERHVESLVADLMDRDIVNLSDDIVLERRRGKDRKAWQSDALLSLLFARSLVDENGEMRDSRAAHNAYHDAVTACVRPAWRTTALRDHGIDPDEYAESSPGRVSVKVEVRDQ